MHQFGLQLKSVKVTDGSKNLYKGIEYSRSLPGEIKKIVLPVIQRNGYFGYPENILVSMISDERKIIRQ